MVITVVNLSNLIFRYRDTIELVFLTFRNEYCTLAKLKPYSKQVGI